jgi:hypothetical protein
VPNVDFIISSMGCVFGSTFSEKVGCVLVQPFVKRLVNDLSEK